jgi:DNA processing protein
MEREELAGWLRLTLTPGIGDRAARQLLAAFGLPHAIFEQSATALEQVVSPSHVRSLVAEPDSLARQLQVVWDWLCAAERPGLRHVLTLASPAYPPGLLNIADPPVLLYAQGVLPAQWPAAIAVVGSRNPTPQGLLNAREFARSFAQAGLTVVSGLALGVDGAAHEGALDGAAPGALATVAVVGTGLDRVYPRQHLALAHRIVEHGLVMSEYPLGTPPLAPNFPKRNRIISALSQGTLVVEAALRSGSLITAGQAAEQGKDVFAIPGSIHSPQSRGCHALLKQGAKLVESALDVLEELRLPQAPLRRADAQQKANREEELPLDDDSFLSALGFDPVSLDALVARTGIAPANLQAELLQLELQGDVARLPGGLFQRVATG